MDTFDDLYCRSIQYLLSIMGTHPVHGVGSISTYFALEKAPHLTAVMLIVEGKNKVPAEDIASGKAVPLKEMIERRPKALSDAVLSWITFEHEENPSTILMHTGVNPAEIKNMCYTRLFRTIPRESLSTEAIKKAAEIADRASLSDPRSVQELLAHQGKA